MKINTLFFSAAVAALLAAGCSSIQNVTPSDLTVAELEAKQMRAVDPGKRISTIKTSVLRQEIKTSNGWMEPETIEMVEIKYQAPDKMSWTTFDENQPISGWIINGDEAWMIDYENKNFSNISSDKLADMKFMQKLVKPDTRMSEIFEQITVDRCTIDEEPLYRLTCVNPGKNPFYFYLSATDYLPRRIISDFNIKDGGTIHYDSQILRYQMREGLLLADETVIEQDGLTQKGKVLYYKVNPKLEEKDFRPPMF